MDCNYPNGICHENTCYCKGVFTGDHCESYINDSWYVNYVPSTESLGFLLASAFSTFALVTTAFYVYSRGYCNCRTKKNVAVTKEIRFNLKDSLLSDDEDDE